jgi:hypothetical protein
MSGEYPKKENSYIKYAIVACTIILVVLGIFAVHEYHVLRHAQILSDIHRGVPLTADDVAIIRPWMTFTYINKIFDVPPDYLKNAMSITDPAYPQLSLSGYANYSHTDIVTLMGQLDTALNNYLTNGAN